MKKKLYSTTIMVTKCALKLLFIIVITISSLWADDVTGQSKNIREVKVSIDLPVASIGQIFRVIERETDFRFIYVSEKFEDQEVNLKRKNGSVADYLTDVANQSNYRFKQINNGISVIPVEKTDNKTLEVEVQRITITVSGKVTSEDGSLPGASVFEKGTSNGTVTDVDGNYKIEVEEDATLVFSFVGFENKEVQVEGRQTIDVFLKIDVQTLADIVVIGYGSQQKKDLTSAISVIESNKIQDLPIINPAQAMQGLATGVSVTSSSGAPGDNPLVRIRGVGTVNSTDPLYVVDGVPTTNLNSVNPQDIESIQVLKDAASAAIYGSRGANGVIIVNTKDGSGAKGTNIYFSGFYGVQELGKDIQALNSQQYSDLVTEIAQVSSTGFQSQQPPQAARDYLDGTNQIETPWVDELFATGPASIQNYNFGVANSGESGSYNISAGYFSQEGVIIHTGFDKVNFRINSQLEKGRVRIGESLGLTYSERMIANRPAGQSLLRTSFLSTPTMPILDPDALGGYKGPTSYDAHNLVNPIGIQNLIAVQNQSYDLLGNAFLEFDILKSLTYKFNYGLILGFDNNTRTAQAFRMSDVTGTGLRTISDNYNRGVRHVLENTITYKERFGKHNITALIGYTQERQTFRSVGVETADFLSENFVTVGTGSQVLGANGQLNEDGLSSILGRLLYAFDDKYLLTANFRRDGSSRFSQANRYAVFPSFSVGWRFSDESFMEGLTWLNEGKLRGSYGLVGNQNISRYNYETNLNLNSNYVFYDASGNEVLSQGVVQKTLPNPNAKWESTEMYDIGIEATLFNNKIELVADYFVKNTKDMLLQVAIPPSSGSNSAPFANVGEVVNKGYELTLSYFDNWDKFELNITGNVTGIQNELTRTDLNANAPIVGGDIGVGNVTLSQPGQPIGTFYGFVTDGIYLNQQEIDEMNSVNPETGNPIIFAPNVKPGDIRFKDLDGDGRLTDKDRDFIGNPFPDLVTSLDLNLTYGSFDIRLFFYGVFGNEIFNETKFYTESLNSYVNQTASVLDRWTPENTNTNIPRATPLGYTHNLRVSDRFVEDGSYIRLQTVTFGYSLPSKLLEKISVQKLRVYFQAQNLFTFTDYSFYDPEVGQGETGADDRYNLYAGIDRGNYPLVKSYNLGFKIDF